MKTVTVKAKAVKALEAANFLKSGLDESGYKLDKMESGAYKVTWYMWQNHHNGVARSQVGEMADVLSQAGLSPYVQDIGSALILRGDELVGKNTDGSMCP